MKKLFLNFLAVMLLLAAICPITLNAAELKVDKDNMKVGEKVQVTISTKEELESFQFDLKFDNKKYKFIEPKNYMLNDDDLNSAMAHEIAPGVVRVSAIDTGLNKTDDITLEFEAIAEGTAVPFTVTGVVELGENGRANATEKLEGLTIKVAKIGEDSNGAGGNVNNGAGQPQYVNDAGQVITTLPQTNEKSCVGIYKSLVTGYTVVPYIFSDSEEVLYGSDIKREFPNATDMSINSTAIAKTGDTFKIGGTVYTILIYGDVNKDGKITTSDALAIYKYKDTLDAIQKEAADVKKDGIVDGKDAINIQKFILKIYKPITEEPAGKESLIESLNVTPATNLQDITRYSNAFSVGEVVSTNNQVALTKDSLNTSIVKVNGTQVSNDILSYNESNGVITILVNPTYAGNYEIIAVATGDNVKGGQVTSNVTIKFQVKDDITVNAIKLKHKDQYVYQNSSDVIDVPIKKSITGNADQSRQLEIELYHNYSNGVSANITNQIEANTIKIDYVDAGLDEAVKTLKEENGKKFISLVTKNPNGISAGVTGTLTITVSNFTTTINAKTVELDRNGLVLNNTEYTGTNGTAEVTVYTGNATSLPANTIRGNDGKIYTLIDIAQVDTDGDRQIVNSANIGVNPIFNAQPKKIYVNTSGKSVSLAKFNLVDGVKTELTGGAADIVAIGIAITDEAAVQGQDFIDIPVKMNSGTVQLTLKANIVSLGTTTTKLDDEESEEDKITTDNKSENKVTNTTNEVSATNTVSTNNTVSNTSKNEVTNNTISNTTTESTNTTVLPEGSTNTTTDNEQTSDSTVDDATSTVPDGSEPITSNNSSETTVNVEIPSEVN